MPTATADIPPDGDDGEVDANADPLAQRIARELALRNKGIRPFEAEAGLRRDTLRNFLSGHVSSPRLVTVQKIAAALDMSVAELIGETAGGGEASWAVLRNEAYRATRALLESLVRHKLCTMADSDIEMAAIATAKALEAQLAGKAVTVERLMNRTAEDILDAQAIRRPARRA